ncbi:MAG TPA: hypothetical protein VFX59_14120 [Polyangiales bacterium]|nr:hypothetical protein [Polyangiales bacterium]
MHSLEAQRSTQDIVIIDREQAIGQKLSPTKAQKQRWGADVPRFLVAMRALPDVLASVTDELLKR